VSNGTSIHEITVRVRYPECDPMNVAHHSVFAVWLEMARTDMLRHSGVSYRELEAQGVLFVVARMSISFRKPAYYDDDLRVVVRVASASRVKIEHEYEVCRGNELLATASTTLACVDREGRVRQIPDGVV
jgi:acyl-CoA thioester hydrolase